MQLYPFSDVNSSKLQIVLKVVISKYKSIIFWQSYRLQDGLSGIEDAIKRFYPNSKHQLCGVHLKRNILSLFPHNDKINIALELINSFFNDNRSLHK